MCPANSALRRTEPDTNALHKPHNPVTLQPVLISSAAHWPRNDMRNRLWMMDPVSNKDEIHRPSVGAIVELFVDERIPGSDTDHAHDQQADHENYQLTSALAMIRCIRPTLSSPMAARHRRPNYQAAPPGRHSVKRRVRHSSVRCRWPGIAQNTRAEASSGEGRMPRRSPAGTTLSHTASHRTGIWDT